MSRQIFVNGTWIHEDGTEEYFVAGQWISEDQAAGGGEGVTASLTKTLDDVTVSATADATIVGSLSKALDDVTVSASATKSLTYAEVTDTAIGYWKLDETSGTTANDETDTYNGTYETTLPADDSVSALVPWGGTAIDFAAAQGRITLGDVLDLEKDEPFTLSAWVKLNDPESQNFAVINKHTTWIGYVFWIVDYGAYHYMFIRGSGAGNDYFAIRFNRTVVFVPQHVVMTYDGSNTLAGFKCYEDGVEMSVYSAYEPGGVPGAGIAGTVTNTYATEIGKRTNGPILANGCIDEVLVFDYELEQVDIDALFAGPTIGITATLTKTLDDVTVSATADTTVVGSLSKALDDVTVSATADAIVIGSLVKTLDDVVASAAADTTVVGLLTKTLDDVTVSATADATVIGSLVKTLDDVTVSATADTTVVGSLSKALDDVTVSAAATIVAMDAVVGSLVKTLDDVVASAAADTTVVGLLTKTLDDVIVSATADMTVEGSLTRTLDDVTVSATATVMGEGVLASLIQTLDDVIVSANATQSLTYEEVILTAEAYWKLDEDSSGLPATAVDETANDYDGTYVTAGPELVSGLTPWSDGASDFAATGGHVNMGNIFAYEKTDQFSFSLWMKVTATPQLGNILSKQLVNGWVFWITEEATNYYIYLAAPGSDSMQYRWSRSAGSDARHVVLTYDGSNDLSGFHLYENGIELTPHTPDPGPIIGSTIRTGDFTLGGRTTTPTYFPGVLDEVLIFDYVLSQSQVDLLLNGPSLVINASLTQTLADVAVSATSSAVVTATATNTLDSVSLSSSATSTVVGQVAVTLDSVVATATATLTIQGAVTKILDDVSVNATATVVSKDPVVGQVGSLLEDVVVTAVASSSVVGTVSTTLEAVTLASTGTSPFASTMPVKGIYIVDTTERIHAVDTTERILEVTETRRIIRV